MFSNLFPDLLSFCQVVSQMFSIGFPPKPLNIFEMFFMYSWVHWILGIWPGALDPGTPPGPGTLGLEPGALPGPMGRWALAHGPPRADGPSALGPGRWAQGPGTWPMGLGPSGRRSQPDRQKKEGLGSKMSGTRAFDPLTLEKWRTRRA